MESKATSIYIESTPNPNTMKFVANYLLVQPDFFHDFTSYTQTSGSPLAKLLFEKFSWVKEVFFSSNYITLTKKEDTDWMEVQGAAREFITKALTKGVEVGEMVPDIHEQKEPKFEEIPANAGDEEIVAKIKGVLDEYIKPAVEQDGGAISFHSFDKGLVKVLLQGSCSGCPSSTITLKAGIETLLKSAIPAVETVEALDG
ncbi:MAG: NifU family protein [Cyclobacteriaceae bacterium]|nr:NifU family protein [Cyclobacteriaceae bacterium]